MIWFLERPGERLQCEIRRSALGVGYELVWTCGDGRTHVELSEDPEELLRRRRALENWLRLDGWVRPGRVTRYAAGHGDSPRQEAQQRGRPINSYFLPPTSCFLLVFAL